MLVTRNIARYVQNIGINTSELARKIGAPYTSIYRSVGIKEPTRELKADELLAICGVLGLNPMDFARDMDKGA